MNAYIMNEKDNINVFIERINDGLFTVRIYDVDAQMFLDSISVFPTEDSAREYANKFA